MNTSAVIDMLRDGVGVVLKIAGPMLLLSMLVGVIVAVFQAVTQIHEQTIGFILKVAVIVIVLLLGGNWMLELLKEFTYTLFGMIAG